MNDAVDPLARAVSRELLRAAAVHPVGSKRRATALAAGVGMGLAGAGYLVRRLTANASDAEAALVAAGRALPVDLTHRYVPTGDGGRIHVVQRGSGPPVVLVHGVGLGVAVWAPQLRHLAANHQVTAIGLRGHGQSVAGSAGYTFDRMAEDVYEVLQALSIRDGVMVGHSMGGMVVLTLAVQRPRDLGVHVGGLVLVGTSAGPLVPGPVGPLVAPVLMAGGARGLRYSDRRGGSAFDRRDITAWITRSNFGSHPRPADLQLVRSMVSTMSPSTLAGLLGPLLTFDLRRRIGEIDLPTRVVVGSRDLLTPPRAARTIAQRIPDATLSVLRGCGHLVMLERARELDYLVDELSSSIARTRGHRQGL
jgi:non-heme chloroperoxidase